MSAVRLIWLMGSRGVLFAALAVLVLLLASTPFVLSGLGVPNTEPVTYWACRYGFLVEFPGCIAVRPIAIYETWLVPIFTLAIGLLYGAYRGLQHWRSRALAGW